MKAKLVNETTGFKRGLDPKDVLGLGGIRAQKARLEKFGDRLSKATISNSFLESLYDPHGEQNSEGLYTSPGEEADFEGSLILDLEIGHHNDQYLLELKKDNAWVFELKEGWNEAHPKIYVSTNEDDMFDRIIELGLELLDIKMKKKQKSVNVLLKAKKKIQVKYDILETHKN